MLIIAVDSGIKSLGVMAVEYDPDLGRISILWWELFRCRPRCAKDSIRPGMIPPVINGVIDEINRRCAPHVPAVLLLENQMVQNRKTNYVNTVFHCRYGGTSANFDSVYWPSSTAARTPPTRIVNMAPTAKNKYTLPGVESIEVYQSRYKDPHYANKLHSVANFRAWLEQSGLMHLEMQLHRPPHKLDDIADCFGMIVAFVNTLKK